jgi:hypothetical protein
VKQVILIVFGLVTVNTKVSSRWALQKEEFMDMVGMFGSKLKQHINIILHREEIGELGHASLSEM